MPDAGDSRNPISRHPTLKTPHVSGPQTLMAPPDPLQPTLDSCTPTSRLLYHLEPFASRPLTVPQPFGRRRRGMRPVGDTRAESAAGAPSGSAAAARGGDTRWCVRTGEESGVQAETRV